MFSKNTCGSICDPGVKGGGLDRTSEGHLEDLSRAIRGEVRLVPDQIKRKHEHEECVPDITEHDREKERKSNLQFQNTNVSTAYR